MLRAIRITLAGVAASTAALAPLPVAALDLHVARAGRDTGAGTRDDPFLTLERARDEIRVLRKAGRLRPEPVTVWLRRGEHLRARPLIFEAQDGGTVAAPIAYRAWPGERPVLVGATPLEPSAVRPLEDAAVRARLPAAARTNVVAVDLARLGIANVRRWPDIFRDNGGLIEIIFDGRRLPLARWPNEGSATMKRVLDVGDWSDGPSRRGGVFEYRDDRHARWPVDQGVWLSGFWRVPWQRETVRVAAIDPAARTVRFAVPVPAGIGSKFDRPHGSGAEPYLVVNLLEELDEPGEWTVDFATRTLYLWPPHAIARARVLVSDLAEPMIALRGASRIDLRGLVLEGGLGNGIVIEGGVDNLVAGCEIRHLGGHGIVIEGGARHVVTGCDLHQLGGGGVVASGGDRKTLSAAGHQITNNHIHHFGEVTKVYAAGVAVGFDKAKSAVGIRVANNLIHDAPHVGVLYGGNDNLFELNRVFRVCMVSDDMGGFYSTNDWTSRGNVVRHNFIHHSPRAHGIYLDDGDSGDLIHGNVVQGVDGGVYVGGGRDNVVTGNILVDVRRGLHIDARGVARNYTPKNEGMSNRARQVQPDRPPWSERYPELASHFAGRTDLPEGTLFDSNLCVRCAEGLERRGSDTELGGVTFGALVETKSDPGFRSARALDFGLRESRALRALQERLLRFAPIPFERIGPYRDEHRAVVPRVPPPAELERGLPAPVPKRHWQGG